MPLLTPTEQSNEAVTLQLNAAVWEKINAYCDWAKFERREEFIEQAIEFVLKKDREWKKYQAAQKAELPAQPLVEASTVD
tara:strand:- start:492 stop:731 length:240 start_codon:yes stop_codon:yes gene_type:complete